MIFSLTPVSLTESAPSLKAVILIRKHGLKHRITDPEKFLHEMNKLSALIEKHGWNYHDLLKESWSKTDWSEAEAAYVLRRMKNVLDQLPFAVKQAHERLIGERRVANKDKILSFYERNAHVLIRGKAGAEVEFGNALYLSEQENGLIIDWKFIKDQPPSDSKLMEESLERITKEYGKPRSYTADRGFDSAANRKTLDELEIINAVCPRSVPQLKKQLEDEEFCLLQKRRGCTEARIGIFKTAYLGSPLKSKGFKNRKTRIEWCILAHNLWKIATMAAQTHEAQKQKKVA